MRWIVWFPLVLLLLLAPTTYAQDNGLNDLTLVDAVRIDQYLASVGQDEDVPLFASLSPDGTRIAYEGQDAAQRFRTICVHSFDTTDTVCTPNPEDLQSLEVGLVWSPDGTAIVTTQDAFLRRLESDIWLYDVNAATWANLTDDGVSSAGVLRGENADTALLDVLPTFDPASGDLYFVRYANADDGLDATLQRIAAVDGVISPGTAPQTVANLTEITDGAPVIFGRSPEGLDGAIAISPDGTTVALIVRSFDDIEVADVYLIDTASGVITPFVTSADVRPVNVPQWALDDEVALDGMAINGLAWTADSSELLVYTDSGSFSALIVVLNIYRIDVATGDITAYIDYTPYANQAELFRISDDLPILAQAPRYPVYIAGSDVLIYAIPPSFSDGTPFLGISGVPGDEPTPIVLETPLELAPFSFTFGSRAGDDGTTVRVYQQGVLLTFERTPTSD